MADPKPAITAEALTEEQFYGLLERLDEHREQAALKYEELHWKLVKFFQWSACSGAEELADETLNRTSRKLRTANEKILDVEAFIWGVARKIRQEGRKRDTRTVGLSDIPNESFASDGGASIEALNSKLQSQKERGCLHGCLERLPVGEQELFLAYRIDKVNYVETRKKLAEGLGLSSGALRVRILRLREKLEKCVSGCLRGHLIR